MSEDYRPWVPTSTRNGDQPMTMLTKREWMAARAPADPKLWFRFEFSGRPPQPARPMASERAREMATNWQADPIYDLYDTFAGVHKDATAEELRQVREYETAMQRFRAESEALERAAMRARERAWRYAWADMMLEEAPT